MIMERQGIFRGFQIVSGYSFVWVFLAVLLLSVSGWGACETGSFTQTRYGSGLGLPYLENGTYCNMNCGSGVDCRSSQFCAETSFRDGNYYFTNCGDCYARVGYCTSVGYSDWVARVCTTRCNTKCEADSINCVNVGKDWNSDACECTDPCNNIRNQCESLGGEFEGRAINKPGSPGTRCCNGVCNLCTTKASEEQWEKKKYYCCSQNKAPPAMNNCAIESPPVGCGISTKFKTNSDNGACRDPNLSEDASQSFYENCSGVGSSSSEGGNSSGAGSSGTDGSSSSGVGPYPEGCDECPWLDSILDTLIATKGKLQGIEECLENATVCMDIVPGVGDTNDYAGYLDSIIVLLDSGLSNDRYAINYLGSIDSSLQKMMDKDSVARETERNLLQAGLKNDTNIRRTLADGNYNVDTNFISLKKAIYDLDTATIHHLDSIVKHLPDSILDSIRKYQDSALDRFDSALWGKGVGFSLIDSMIDSVVKYFQVSNHYDSAYAVMFGESMDRLMSKMDDMSFGIDANLSFQVELDYGPLGYGDTASVTLRDDINRMREDITNAILDIDTSVGNELKELVEEQKGFYIFSTGYGVSGSSTLKDDINNIAGDLVRKLDSTWSHGNADTGVVNVPIGNGNLTADSIANDYGFNKINFASDTAAAVAAERAQLVEDSTSLCVGDECVHYQSQKHIDDSLASRVQGAADSIRQQNEDFYRDSMDGLFARVLHTLDSINPFGVFDSTLMKTIGAKIPNTNTCPENCSKSQADIPFLFGIVHTTIDYGLCLPRVPLGNVNILQFFRFLIRCIVAITCIGMVMNAIPKR